MTAVKAIIEVFSGSTALIADSFHSASDLIGTLILLQGMKIANQPPDQEHPYGHFRAESITAKILAMILILTALSIGYKSLEILRMHEIVIPNKIAIYAALLSIVTKEWMFLYSYRIGKKIKSSAVVADAWHHRSYPCKSLQ